MKTLRRIDFSDIHQDALIGILKRNVPKYFSEGDIADFRQYLRERPWDGHDVFVAGDEIVGCASFYRKSPGVVGLSWMFFEPGQIGHRRILPELEKYLENVQRRIGDSDSRLLFSLNTTPRVAKLLRRIGFAPVETVKDGYGPGYDRVRMER